MRTLLLMGILAAAPAAARDAHRGWLTGAGLTLAGVGAVALSLGAYDAAQSEAASHALGAYYAHGAAPTVREASTVRWLHERSEQLGARGLGLLIAGGAAVAIGIAGVLLDGWLGTTSVAVSLRPGRLVVSGSF